MTPRPTQSIDRMTQTVTTAKAMWERVPLTDREFLRDLERVLAYVAALEAEQPKPESEDESPDETELN